MSDLAFQYIGYGCVFLAALRVVDVAIHVFLGVILKAFRLDNYYYFAVDVMSYERKLNGYTTVTGTENDN
jgi:hypothetical protein